MSVPTEILKILTTECPLCQGDIFKNIKYNYITMEDRDTIEIEECIFPHAIVISQACDTIAASKLFQEKNGSISKFMPTVLLCPIYSESKLRSGEHIGDVLREYEITTSGKLYNSDTFSVIKSKLHLRYFSLNLVLDAAPFLENSIIDFKHCFSMPINVLIKQKNNRIGRVNDYVAEEITQRFCSYLSRMAISE